MASIPKYCDTPEKVEEWKAKRRALNKAYQQTPKYKARAEARKQTLEFKAYRKAYDKAYNQTPEYKAQQTAYRQTPENKAAFNAYCKAHYQTRRKEQSTADAFRMMQAASELAKALTNLSKTTPKNK